MCPRWPAPSQRSVTDGPLPSPVPREFWTPPPPPGLSRVWPPWDPGQSRPAEPFPPCHTAPRKSALTRGAENPGPTRRQVQGQASPTAPTSGPQGSAGAAVPPGMDASGPIGPAEGLTLPGEPRGVGAPWAGVTLPLHQSGVSFGSIREPVEQCSWAHTHSRGQAHTGSRAPSHTRAQLCSTCRSDDFARLHSPGPKTTPAASSAGGPAPPPRHVYSWPCPPIRLSVHPQHAPCAP